MVYWNDLMVDPWDVECISENWGVDGGDDLINLFSRFRRLREFQSEFRGYPCVLFVNQGSLFS